MLPARLPAPRLLPCLLMSLLLLLPAARAEDPPRQEEPAAPATRSEPDAPETATTEEAAPATAEAAEGREAAQTAEKPDADATGAAETLTTVPVLAVYRTQTVHTVVQPRCGEGIAPVLPPPPSLLGRSAAWIGLGPSPDVVPPPLFQRRVVCTDVSTRIHGLASYRAHYRFEGEEYSVDLDRDPGDSLQVDATGRVIEPAPAR